MTWKPIDNLRDVDPLTISSNIVIMPLVRIEFARSETDSYSRLCSNGMCY